MHQWYIHKTTCTPVIASAIFFFFFIAVAIKHSSAELTRRFDGHLSQQSVFQCEDGRRRHSAAPGHFLSRVYRISAWTGRRLIVHVQVVDTTEREGDAAWRCTQVTEPTLSDYSWSRGVCVCVCLKGERKKRERNRKRRREMEERRGALNPSPLLPSPPPDSAGAVN